MLMNKWYKGVILGLYITSTLGFCIPSFMILGTKWSYITFITRRITE